MRKIYVTMLILINYAPFVKSQWVYNGNSIYNENFGNVGIGTNNPIGRLQISKSNFFGDPASTATSIDNLLILQTPYQGSIPANSNGTGYKWGIQFWGRADTNVPDQGKTGAIYAVSEDGQFGFNRAIGLAFHTTPFDGTSIERLRISAIGNVGIGNSNPLAKLDVAGPVHIAGNHIYPIPAAQGTYLNWNHSNGGGETDFINHRGVGTGGFAFYNTDNVNPGNMLMFLSGAGNLGVGTSAPQYKLDVIGTIRSHEVKVDLNGADFVFDDSYMLRPLNDLEKFVKINKHLPDVASAEEMQKNGADLGNLNSVLLQKIEELTLYMIKQNKKILDLEKKVKSLEAMNK
jgi:hypothetical protein